MLIVLRMTRRYAIADRGGSSIRQIQIFGNLAGDQQSCEFFLPANLTPERNTNHVTPGEYEDDDSLI
jgi:hypothetical protein